MYLPDGIRQQRGRQHPAHPPPRHRIRLAHAADQDGAFPHAVEGRDGDVHGAIVQNVLVDFVGNRQRVEFAAQAGDEFQFLPAEHLPGGIIGRIQNDRLGARGKRAPQFLPVEVPVRLAQRDEARGGAAELRIRPVVLVKRLEQDHFVARVDHRQERRNHPLRGAATDRDFTLRVELHAVGAGVLGGDGVAQRLGAPGDGVLVDVRADGFRRGLLERFGSREIGESLSQVDGPMAHRQAGHFADYGFGETERAAAAKTLPPGRGRRCHRLSGNAHAAPLRENRLGGAHPFRHHA